MSVLAGLDGAELVGCFLEGEGAFKRGLPWMVGGKGVALCLVTLRM